MHVNANFIFALIAISRSQRYDSCGVARPTVSAARLSEWRETQFFPRLHHFVLIPRIAIWIPKCHRDVDDHVELGIVGPLLDRFQYFVILIGRLVLVLAQKRFGNRVGVSQCRDGLRRNCVPTFSFTTIPMISTSSGESSCSRLSRCRSSGARPWARRSSRRRCVKPASISA